MSKLNRHSNEVREIIALIDTKIASYRGQLESEMTDITELPKHRAKLAAMSTLKKDIEEMCNVPE